MPFRMPTEEESAWAQAVVERLWTYGEDEPPGFKGTPGSLAVDAIRALVILSHNIYDKHAPELTDAVSFPDKPSR